MQQLVRHLQGREEGEALCVPGARITLLDTKDGRWHLPFRAGRLNWPVSSQQHGHW